MSNTDMPYSIYQQAIAFWLTYERCMMYINQNGQIILPIPAMANSAFAIESFLKAILKERNTPYDKRQGHRLDYLFHLLPNPTKESIINAVNHPDFDMNLSCCSKSFEDFRYLHEDVFKSQKINLQFWEKFINAIYAVANETIVNKGSPVSLGL